MILTENSNDYFAGAVRSRENFARMVHVQSMQKLPELVLFLLDIILSAARRKIALVFVASERLTPPPRQLVKTGI